MSEEAGGYTPRTVVIVSGALLLAFLLWKEHRVRPEAPPAPDAPLPTRLEPDRISDAEAVRDAEPVGASYQRDVDRPKPVQSAAAAAAPAEDPPAPGSGLPASRRRDEKKTLPEIFRMPGQPAPPAAPGATSLASPAPPPAAVRGLAPFGRMLKCQLVDTLDSLTARSSPIVGLVTDDLDWNGAVVIPAGTEVFSYAKPQAVLDAAGAGRLVDDGEWTLVLPSPEAADNGRELLLRGRAVDRAEGADGRWLPADGRDGLSGATLSTLDNQEIKLFAAAAMGGMAQGLAAVSERQEPASGVAGALGATQIAPTLGNAAIAAAGAGTTALMNELASRIRDEVSKRGVYVRVPAGKLFYLFVEQSIDPSRARMGARLPGQEGKAP
ncbi:MAG TPA: TrbI/VirB10 family protein [Opitutaceae bacterium]|jgi:hypothetical protein